jgi:hypothetical protein
MKFIKDNLLTVVILVLLSIIVLQKCGAPAPVEAPTVVRDTTWIVKDSLIVSKPQLIKSISIESHDTIINQYLPDTNYAKLVLQYQEVVNTLLAKNIHSDSIRIDSNGYVKITDTVQRNLITGRSSQVNIRYPIIKETITLPAKKVAQMYMGGLLQANPGINQVGVGALLKTRNDFLFGTSLGVNTDGNIQYGVGAYWKLKLKK